MEAKNDEETEAIQIYLERLAENTRVMLTFKVLVSVEELVQLYQRARMTVCVPVLEPFGFTPLESVACGTPVVGVAEDGMRETIRLVRLVC